MFNAKRTLTVPMSAPERDALLCILDHTWGIPHDGIPEHTIRCAIIPKGCRNKQKMERCMRLADRHLGEMTHRGFLVHREGRYFLTELGIHARDVRRGERALTDLSGNEQFLLKFESLTTIDRWSTTW